MTLQTPGATHESLGELATRDQWYWFAGAVLLFHSLGVFPELRAIAGRGLEVRWWQLLPTAIANAVVAVAFARPIWWLFDRWPLGREERQWITGVTVRGASIPAYLLIGGWCSFVLARGAAWILHAAAVTVTHGIIVSAADIAARAAPGIAMIVVAHVLVQRWREQRRLAALEGSLADARLQALSLQLQPHFLFNTLNGIAALIRVDARLAEQMIVSLSDLLRATLDRSAEGVVPLSVELSHLELYVSLQLMRFGPRLTITREIDPATRAAEVPAMVLQPLVENALTHGIGRREGPGQLCLRSRQEGEMLVLCVEDDGVGLSRAPARMGTGIGATRARLAAMFNGTARLTLRPRNGGGTVAEVRLPMRDSRRPS
jgi:two-component sensor histidine kinase